MLWERCVDALGEVHYFAGDLSHHIGRRQGHIAFSMGEVPNLKLHLSQRGDWISRARVGEVYREADYRQTVQPGRFGPEAPFRVPLRKNLCETPQNTYYISTSSHNDQALFEFA